jgi:hypothetical protein
MLKVLALACLLALLAAPVAIVGVELTDQAELADDDLLMDLTDAEHEPGVVDLGDEESGAAKAVRVIKRPRLGEGVAPVPQKGIQVVSTIFAGGTSQRRWDNESEACYSAAISKVAQVTTVQVAALKQVDRIHGNSTKVPTKEKEKERPKFSHRTSEEGVELKTVISGLTNADVARAAADALEQSLQGGKNSRLAVEYAKQQKKHPTMDQQAVLIFKVVSKPVILGVVDSQRSPLSRPKPKWCKGYLAKRQHRGKRAWTARDCRASSGTYADALKNIDGVICQCNGTKALVRNRDTANPDYQTASAVMGQGAKRGSKYRAYSFQVKTPRSKKRTSHEGMQYHLEFERESGDKKDGQHKVSRQHVKIEFNRIVEYMDNEGTGLTDQVTRRIDPVTKKEMGGVSCDAGQTTSKAHPGKNCVLQDFYLDRFKKMVYSDDGNRKLFSMQSDLQGTSPWCTDPSAACAQKVRSSLKPSVAFDIGFGQAAGSGVDFAHAKMNVTISNFPYKFKNSTLALRSKVFALSMTSDLSKEDQKFKAGQLDSMDCNKQPLPSGCPIFKVDGNVKLSWNKFVSDASNEKKHFKVVSTMPTKAPPPSDSKDRNGQSLPVQNSYFSFKHEGVQVLKWDPKVAVGDLPKSQYNAAMGLHQPWMTTACVVLLANLAAVGMAQ